MSKRQRNISDSSSEDSDEPLANSIKRRTLKKSSESEKSESGSDSSEGEFVFEYGEDLIKDEEDKKEIEGMNERDREMLMSERYEKREMALEKFNAIRDSKDAEKKKKMVKKKQPARSTRKQDETKAKAREKLKEKRKSQAKKAPKPEPKSESEEEIESASADDESEAYGDSDSDGGGRSAKRSSRSKSAKSRRASTPDESSDSDSDDDRGTGRDNSTSAVADFEDVQSIRLSRHKLERWCHEPFFEEMVKGCFVRIGIGEHHNRPICLLAQIVRVVERSSYSLGRTRTKKAILLRHGKDERTMKMATVSNQPATEREFQRWQEALKDNNFKPPNKRLVKEKLQDIDHAKDFVHRNKSDVDKVLAEKRRAGVVSGSSAARIQQLRANVEAFVEAKELHESRNEHDQASDMGEKLQDAQKELENMEQLHAQRQQKRTQTHASNVSEINDRNYDENFRIRKARKEKRKLEKERRTSQDAAAKEPQARRPSTQTMVEAHTSIDLDIDLDDLDVEIDDQVPQPSSQTRALPTGPRYTSALQAFKAKRGLI